MATAIQSLDVRLPEVAEQVRAIHLAAYSQEAKLVGVMSLPPMERSASQIQSLSESFFGAFSNGFLAGAISELEGDGSQVEICSLAVHPAFQRLGVGRALVEHSIVRAAGRPMQVSTAAANIPAAFLYQSLGFQVLRHSLVPGLRLQLVQLQRPGSNPSVKGTSCAEAQAAPYVER
jgi:ribosomal protein S18 acetylase RimI-like enzyme